MYNSICIAQTVKELRFLLSRLNDKILIVPLDLEVQVFCIKNKLKYLDPKNYLDATFHKKAIEESEKLMINTKFENLNYNSHLIIAETFVRFRFNSIYFLKSLVEKIIKKENINKIFLSGWNRYESEYSLDNYYATEIIKSFFDKRKIFVLSKENLKKKKSIFQIANIRNIRLNKNKKNILISNLGYNLFRFIINFRRKYNIIVPECDKINFFKKMILKYFFNVSFLSFKYEIANSTKILSPKIDIRYNNKKIKSLLIKRFNQEINNLINLKLKSLAIDEMFKKIDFFLVISHNVRGENGYYLEKAHELRINTICVPHGTVSKAFNKYDKIYKKIIADSVIFKHTKFIAAQSKITKNYLNKNQKLKNKILKRGNFIFAEITKKNKIQKKMLFAVTLKKFFNIQFLGVETFYEFMDNLKFLNNFSKTKKIEIQVNLHPAAKESLNDFKILFPHLKFNNERIDDALKKIDMTISFSSTVIEDSLCSNIPVILFDRWKRYQHCEAQKDYSRKNSPIYYVNQEKNLISCINSIYNSKRISYKKYTYEGNFNSNIAKFINSIEKLK